MKSMQRLHPNARGRGFGVSLLKTALHALTRSVADVAAVRATPVVPCQFDDAIDRRAVPEGDRPNDDQRQGNMPHWGDVARLARYAERAGFRPIASRRTAFYAWRVYGVPPLMYAPIGQHLLGGDVHIERLRIF